MTEIQWLAFVILPVTLAVVAFAAARLFERAHPLPDDATPPGWKSVVDADLALAMRINPSSATIHTDWGKLLQEFEERLQDANNKRATEPPMPDELKLFLESLRRGPEVPEIEPEPEAGPPRKPRQRR